MEMREVGSELIIGLFYSRLSMYILQECFLISLGKQITQSSNESMEEVPFVVWFRIQELAHSSIHPHGKR